MHPAAVAQVFDAPPLPEVAAGALSGRLQVIIGSESVLSFSRRCGLAESVLRTYLRDGRMPPLDKALAIATAAGITVDWLATGNGPRATAEVRAVYAASPASAANPEAPLLDMAVLEGVLKTVLEERGADPSPRQLAARAADLYRRAIEGVGFQWNTVSKMNDFR